MVVKIVIVNKKIIKMAITLERFKEKHKNLIEKGVITFDKCFGLHFIIIDRFTGSNFLCSNKELNSPRSDVKKMGYTLRGDIGHYAKKVDVD